MAAPVRTWSSATIRGSVPLPASFPDETDVNLAFAPQIEADQRVEQLKRWDDDRRAFAGTGRADEKAADIVAVDPEVFAAAQLWP
jgi:hypothetical protein